MWVEGDFGYDGVVDILDAADFFATGLFDTGSYAPASTAMTAVPEPVLTGAALLAGVVVLGCLGRRHGPVRTAGTSRAR